MWYTGHVSNVSNNSEVKDDSYSLCLQLGSLKFLKVTNDDGEVLNTLLVLLETQNLAHMFGGTCYHKLLGQWDKCQVKQPSTGARKNGAQCPDIIVT